MVTPPKDLSLPNIWFPGELSGNHNTTFWGISGDPGKPGTEVTQWYKGIQNVSGCVWWGRGGIQTTGIYNYSVLNYLLGGIYDVELCTNPNAICAPDFHYKMSDYGELPWTSAFIYWMFNVQATMVMPTKDMLPGTIPWFNMLTEAEQAEALNNILPICKSKLDGAGGPFVLRDWMRSNKTTFKDLLSFINEWYYTTTPNEERNKNLTNIIKTMADFASNCINGANIGQTGKDNRAGQTKTMALNLQIIHPPPLPTGTCHFKYDDGASVDGNTWCAKSKNWCKLNTLKNLAPQDSDLSFCGLLNRAQTCSQWGSPDVAGGGYVQAGDIACVVDTNYAKCSIDCSHVVKPASL